MNTQLFWAYLAIGTASKWLTMKHPTPGEKITGMPVILAGAIFVAWLIPREFNLAVIPVLAIFHCGEIVGRVISIIVDKVRVFLAVRGVRAELTDYKNGYTPETDW